jgi:ssDNA-binding replication factor A large subunit
LLKVPKVEGCVVQTKVPEEIQNYFKFKGVSKEEVDETKNKLTSKEVVPVKISI